MRFRFWFAKLLWLVRPKRLVRLHLPDPEPSIEGVLVGIVAGHYRLLKSVLHESAERSLPLNETWVRVERVVFVQVLK